MVSVWAVGAVPDAECNQGSTGLLPAHAATLLMLEVDDLKAAHRYCVKAGVDIVELPNCLYMIIADPDGLQIEVWQADDEEEPR